MIFMLPFTQVMNHARHHHGDCAASPCPVDVLSEGAISYKAGMSAKNTLTKTMTDA